MTLRQRKHDLRLTFYGALQTKPKPKYYLGWNLNKVIKNLLKQTK